MSGGINPQKKRERLKNLERNDDVMLSFQLESEAEMNLLLQ